MRLASCSSVARYAFALPYVNIGLLTQTVVQARIRDAHVDDELTELAGVARQTVADIAADLVLTNGVVFARVQQSALVYIDLAARPSPAERTRAVVARGRNNRAYAVVDAWRS